MKRLAATVLSLALLYANVAWALGRCLSGHERHEHSAQEPHDHEPAAVNGSGAAAAPVFHCPTEDLRIGPAAQSGSGRLKHTEKIEANCPAWFYPPAQAPSSHGRWLDAVFRSVFLSSHGGGIGRHLLFSVLQI
ncbi:MAG TPA: hypothetical protein VNM15_02105 [Candidatus Binatia bacterium]|nr:hypothetical protein [Candidatus Binatia bacterium]